MGNPGLKSFGLSHFSRTWRSPGVADRFVGAAGGSCTTGVSFTSAGKLMSRLCVIANTVKVYSVLERFRKVLESSESVVIDCLAPVQLLGGAQCASLNTARLNRAGFGGGHFV